MNSIVLSTANSKTDRNNVLRLNLTSDLKLEDNLVSLSHCSVYYTWKNFKREYGNTDFTYTDLQANVTYPITIPDGSYSIKDINHFIHHSMNLNSHVNSDGTFGIDLYANSVYNRVTISVSADYRFSMSNGLAETMGFDSSQTSITNTEVNGTLVPKIERVDNVLIHCNLVDNRVTHNSSILYAFVPNDSFGNLLSISPNYPQNRYCRKASFNFVEVYFTDQDGRPLDVEDRLLVELQIVDKNLEQ